MHKSHHPFARCEIKVGLVELTFIHFVVQFKNIYIRPYHQQQKGESYDPAKTQT